MIVSSGQSRRIFLARHSHSVKLHGPLRRSCLGVFRPPDSCILEKQIMAKALSAEEKREGMEQDYAGYKKHFPEVDEITARELRTLLDYNKAVLIDVRTPEEQKVSQLPGRVLTTSQFEEQKDQLKDHVAITYCTAGMRSGKYAAKMKQEGFSVKNLKGSIIAWTHEGYPLVKGDGSGKETSQVHTYGEHWAHQIAEGYEPEYFSKQKGVFEGIKSVLPRWIGGGS